MLGTTLIMPKVTQNFPPCGASQGPSFPLLGGMLYTMFLVGYHIRASYFPRLDEMHRTRIEDALVTFLAGCHIHVLYQLFDLCDLSWGGE